MSDNKQYYYLKLKDNFFDRSEIKAIESVDGGYEYICIMQKMYLRSLCRGGKLMLTDKIPYEIPVLAKVLGHKPESVLAAITIFRHYGLCEILTDQTIYMTEIQAFIGRSSTEAERKREYRARIEGKLQNVQIGQMSGHTSDVRPPELELEIKKEIEIDRRATRFVKPSVQEIQDYLREKNITGIDAEQFHAYYEARGWISKGSKIKSWKACITTWVKHKDSFRPTERRKTAKEIEAEMIQKMGGLK